ncbi:MAG: hypothetical protein NC328_00675 [Muribaculum sp.]|nr:hypothetical protein [Muribaculum sp.]
MKDFLRFAGLASLFALPVTGYAQDVTEPEPNPVETALTISFNVSEPVDGTITTQMPTTYKLDFGASSLVPKSIKDNTSYTEQAPAVAGGDYTFSGTYAYLYIGSADGQTSWTSAPLKATVNQDLTVSLTLDLTKTPSFAEAFNNPGLFTMSLIVPEKLFIVSATNINDKLLDYESIAQTFIFDHIGNYKLITPEIDPSDESTIEKLSSLSLAFKPEISGDVIWACSADGYPYSYQKVGDSLEYVENGIPTPSFTDETDPSTGSLRIRPALSADGQYRVDIPMGTYVMTAMKADGSNEIVAQFTNPTMSLRYAIGMEVSNGLRKDAILASVTPAEGNVNLEQIPSGVEYLQLVFTSVPKIDRSVTENIKLFYNGGTTPFKQISPSNQTFLRLQTQGIANDYENMLHVYLDGGESYINMPGDYTVVFPEGLFLFGESDEPSARLTLNYHIDKQLSFTTIPHDQISLNNFDMVSIVFTNAQKVELNPNATKNITVETLSGTLFGNITEVIIENKIARIMMPENYTDRGVYKVTIPENYFNVTIDDEVIPNQPVERQWYIKELPLPAIEPAEGILPSNQIFEVTLDVGEDKEITSSSDNAYTRLLRVDDNGDFVYKPEVSYFKVDMPENSIGSSFLTLIPKSERALTLSPGNYVFIPAAYIYTLSGGATNGEYFYFWTVLPDLPDLAQPTVTPNEHVDSSAMFTLTFGADDVIRTISKGLSYLYPLNDNGTVGEYVASFDAVKGAASNEVDLINTRKDVQLEAGIYSLQTPKGVCWTSDAMAPAYNFTIYYGMESGVMQVLGTDSDLYDAYTISGVKVLDKAPASALGGLSSGIYIVNGKKIVIK